MWEGRLHADLSGPLGLSEGHFESCCPLPHGYTGCSEEPKWPEKGAGIWGWGCANNLVNYCGQRSHSLSCCYAPWPIIIATSSEKSFWIASTGHLSSELLPPIPCSSWLPTPKCTESSKPSKAPLACGIRGSFSTWPLPSKEEGGLDGLLSPPGLSAWGSLFWLFLLAFAYL